MIKFLHTADLQIGMTAPGVGDLAEQIQQARVESLKTILQLAKTKSADFVLIAGDLFESNQVSKKYIQQAVMLLEGAKPLRIFILPGNHDYYGSASIFKKNEFVGIGKHVHILAEQKPVALSDLDLTLYPNPCFESRSSELPMLWIKKQPGTKYHIAVLHGSIPSLFGGTQEEDNFYPMEEDVLNNLGMNYIALGHSHSLQPNPMLDADSVFYYSGTPEPDRFGRRMSGYVLFVEIDDAGRKVTPVPVAKFKFEEIHKSIAHQADIDTLKAELLTRSGQQDMLVRVVVDGIVSISLHDALEQLLGEMKEKFALLRRDDNNLLLEPDTSDLDQFMKGGIAHTTFMLLKKKRDEANSSDRLKYSRAISLAYKAFKGHLE